VPIGEPEGGFIDSVAVRLGEGWFTAGAGIFHSGRWVYGYHLSSNNSVTPHNPSTSSEESPDLARSGDQLGMLWTQIDPGTSDSYSIKLSIRDLDGIEVAAKTIAQASILPKRAVIAPRSPNGFGILWHESGALYFREVDSNGDVIAGCSGSSPLAKGFADFLPDQMVATKRGYLAVSGYNAFGTSPKVVKLQEILASTASEMCSWGSNFADIGTGTETDLAHIAGGTSGFAVVWDDKASSAGTVYARTFGPNLCD
jgi:hypothetical protein